MHRRIRPYATLSGLGPFYIAPPSYTHEWSMDMDGSTENLREFQTTNKLGYNDSWTTLMWVKPVSTAPGRIMLEIEGSANDWNGFTLGSITTASGLRMKITNNGNTVNKTYDLAGGLSLGSWGLYGATWNGTDFKCFKDGSDITASMTKTVDGSVTQLDTVYKISVGANQANGTRHAGVYHSLMIWDEPLTAAEITALYNSGSPIDPRSDAGDYASSANLIRLFWIGHLGPTGGDSSTWGLDLISGGIDLMAGAQNLTSGDVVTDVPT